MMPVRWPVRSVLCGEIRPAGSHTRSNMHAREQQRQMDWPDVRVTTGIQSYDTPLPSVRPNPHIIHPKWTKWQELTINRFTVCTCVHLLLWPLHAMRARSPCLIGHIHAHGEPRWPAAAGVPARPLRAGVDGADGGHVCWQHQYSCA
ncbi:uncharacterized protein LOC119272171 [Triticum dicoccoides]|uniref:Uncharacterized protein n=1 Tax=Triticum urartu TaxID=4572 RepID=A0A8R7P4C3_TRIUA|nr:uncharacterized protein LOC119272171 [Triticum dicoccoides]XP_044328116.1 uncharacterized protein LOC123049218 isoform X1 [Triticum aestivum]